MKRRVERWGRGKGENIPVIKTKWLVVSKAEGWRAGVTWACRERGLIVMRPTFPCLVVTHLLSATPRPHPPCDILLSDSNSIFLHFPLLFIYTISLILSITMLLPVCASCLPVVNPITIYYCLLPLAKTRTNAVVVWDGLAFCDKQRFMSSLFIFFNHECESADAR